MSLLFVKLKPEKNLILEETISFRNLYIEEYF